MAQFFLLIRGCGRGKNFTTVVPLTLVREKILEDFATFFLWEAAADSTLMVESEVILVIVDSASMKYNDPERKRTELARNIMDRMPDGRHWRKRTQTSTG